MSKEIHNTDGTKVLVAFKPAQWVAEYQVLLDKGADTIWATELQIAEFFGRDRTVVNRHIKNAFREGELDQEAASAKIAQVRKDGDREIEREVLQYNLDVILSVGYRVKSPLATEFRKWATSKFKEYLIKGYSLNKELLNCKAEKIKELETQIGFLNEAAFQNQKQITEGFLSIIGHYARSFELLNKYDTEELSVDVLSVDVIYTINYQDVGRRYWLWRKAFPTKEIW